MQKLDKKQQISLETYKKEVEDYLLKTLRLSTATTNELMKDYETEFPTFLKENWNPEVAGCAMLHGY